MKFPAPKASCTEGIFQMQHAGIFQKFVLLMLQIIYQGQVKNDTAFENSNY